MSTSTTVLEDTAVAESVGGILRDVVPTLRPAAVLLLGSFGRDEGVIGVPQCRGMTSDLEVGVVTPKIWRQGYLDAVAARASAILGAGVSVYAIHPSRLHHFRARNYTLGHSRLTIESYEMLAARKVLHRTPSFDTPSPPDPRQLPAWEGVRLLFNRCCELLAHTDFDSADMCSATEMMNWAAKTLIACGAAALIIDGAYHYSTRERLKRLECRSDLCASVFRDPDKALAAIGRATSWKLSPLPEAAPEARTLWFAARSAADEVVRFLFAHELGLTFVTYSELPSRYLASPRVRRDYSDYLSDSRWTPLYHNLFSGLKLQRRGAYRLLGALAVHPSEPWHQRAYLGGLLTLLAMRPDNTVDRVLVDVAVRLVGGTSSAALDDHTAWRSARDGVVRLWNAIGR